MPVNNYSHKCYFNVFTAIIWMLLLRYCGQVQPNLCRLGTATIMLDISTTDGDISTLASCCCCQLVSSIAKLKCFAVSVGAVHNDSTVSVVSFHIAGTLKQKVGAALPASAASPPKRRFDERRKFRRVSCRKCR